ncbi:hypothetical protein GWK47_007746 [Chionoecetes opilio]|uniref:C-type lectin domain-containing protein n=1 Tax=Chionoecetes opilio TaxID=41210 RepID=A0A8J4Y171_CHIOP|nr:hypothetical protein GWK47_007746 [Chionoecetes opilio]
MCCCGTCWVALACTLLLVAGGSTVVAEECVYGVRCSQCPTSHYTRVSNGSLVCCPSCTASVLYHGDFPSGWCACYAEDLATQNPLDPRMIRFPGPARLLVGPGEDSGHIKDVSGDPSIKDAFFIINSEAGGPGQGVFPGQGHSDAGSRASPAVQHALTLLADTLEGLHVRVSRLEAIISRSQDLQQSGSLNRVGTLPPPTPTSPPERSSCPTNYSKIGADCYYVSVWHDYRAIWKDAREACAGLSGKLAEPLTRAQFLGLTRQMNSIPSAKGFSYWLGGLYPGVSWLWAYAGERVTLNPAYWTEEDATGGKVTPGDTSSGRCLSLAYHLESSKYYYFADECGFEKYFICELIDGSQQRKVQ